MAFWLLLIVTMVLLYAPLRSSATSVSLVGVNYGRLGNNLPSPDKVPPLLSSIDVGRVRIYDADPTVLRAFANTGIEMIVGLPDQCIPKMAADANEALNWVRSNVKSYVPATKISTITVGNEVLTSNDTSLPRCLVPAMEALQSALVSLGLDKDIVVTTAHSLAVLATPSYPPSSAVFLPELLPYVCPLLAFLARTGSPFFVNAYPYFAYADDPSGVALDYALLEHTAAGFTDPATGLHYTNLLHAQVDAIYHAIAGATSGKVVVEVRVSETGWPSAGDPNETGATPENAAKYNGNLIRLVGQQKGTPLTPGASLRVFIFALFNENQKVGPASERNYGLFKPDGTPAYNLGIEFPQYNSTTSGGGGGGSEEPPPSGLGGSSSSGYYSISAATRRGTWQQQRVAMGMAVASVSLLLRLLLQF